MKAVMASKPAHVPSELVVDFDFNSIDGAAEDIHAAYVQVMTASPDILISQWGSLGGQQSKRHHFDIERRHPILQPPYYPPGDARRATAYDSCGTRSPESRSVPSTACRGDAAPKSLSR